MSQKWFTLMVANIPCSSLFGKCSFGLPLFYIGITPRAHGYPKLTHSPNPPLSQNFKFHP